LIPGGNIVHSPAELVKIKNDPAYNEAWPRAVVTYRAVHGVDVPDLLPWLPNDGSLHPALPAGTPYGLVGTSSVYKRESFPGSVTPWDDTFDGLDAFNTYENDQSSNWSTQGSDAGKYSNSDIWAIRLLAMEPNTAARRRSSTSTGCGGSGTCGCSGWHSSAATRTAAPATDIPTVRWRRRPGVRSPRVGRYPGWHSRRAPAQRADRGRSLCGRGRTCAAGAGGYR